jgi:hypothetical protein
MQSLTKEFKKTWYRFEEQNLDHDYTFKKYCEHLLDLIENSINRHLHHAQLFSNAKQKKKQSMQAFNAFLNNLENQLTSYIEKQRITHLFIKLRSKLRAALTNYQNLFITKKELLISTSSLKNNMKKTIDVQTTFDSRSTDCKTSQNYVSQRFGSVRFLPPRNRIDVDSIFWWFRFDSIQFDSDFHRFEIIKKSTKSSWSHLRDVKLIYIYICMSCTQHARAMKKNFFLRKL